MAKAREIMTKKLITVKAETSIAELAKILLEHKINGVPVVDEENNLIGIVTQADLVAQSKMLHIPSMFTFLDSIIFLENPKKLENEIKKITGTTAGEICTRDVVTVEEDTTVEKIATIMTEKKINSIPVMRGPEIVGIIGRGDVIRSLVK